MLSVSCMSFIAGADLCYASFNPYDTPPALSAAMLNSRNSTHTSHLMAAHLSSLEDFAELTLPENSGRDREGFKPSLTLPKDLGRENRGELTKFLGREEKGEKIKLAAACFVTDTTNCSGNEFAGNNADEDDGGVPPGGGDDYELDNDKRCEEEGYLLTSCPEGMKPYNFCPYDNTYFEKCVSSCPSDYVTCEEPYHGVGEACDGKYASCECTPCGSGYDYTTIPEGYVQDGEACLDCDGKTKYKIKPNPCDGYMDCGDMGSEIGAGTCQSGNETLYDNCKSCPYECSLSSCPDNYTCTKEECSGMYCKSGCQSGYDWDAATQTCTEQCAYKCTLDSCPSPFTCDYEECSGKYCKIGCQSGYDWDAATQSCTEQCAYKCTLDSCPSGFVCEKEECSGKYCKIGCAVSSKWYSENTGQCCSNSYQYDESNCPLSGNYHCYTNTCGGKYEDCKVKTTTDTVEAEGVYFATSKEYCPGIKDFTASYITYYYWGSQRRDYCLLEYINNGQLRVEGECLKGEKVFYQCVDADEDCYNFYNQVRNAHDGEIININKDMYCGNLTIFTLAQNVVINGNGHTLSFKKNGQLTWGYNDFWVYNNSNLALKNLKIDSSRGYGLNVLANSFCEGISLSDSIQIFGSSSSGCGIDLDNVSVNAGPRRGRGRSLGTAVISGPVILGEEIYDDYNNPTYYRVIMNGGSITVE